MLVSHGKTKYKAKHGAAGAKPTALTNYASEDSEVKMGKSQGPGILIFFK